MPESCKLNEEQKTEIKRLHALGISEFKLALMFGVYPNTIRWQIGKRPTKRSAPATARP